MSTIGTTTTFETHERTKTLDRTTQQGASVQSGGNLSIISGVDTNIVSSQLQSAGNLSLNAGRNVNIGVAKNTEKMSESISQEKTSLTASVGNSFVEAGFQAYDAAQRFVETLNTHNVNAAPATDSYSISLGDRLGFSLGHGEARDNWTNSITSINGSDSVNIRARELNMTGSLIANQKPNCQDGGNVRIEVDKLSARNLENNSEAINNKSII